MAFFARIPLLQAADARPAFTVDCGEFKANEAPAAATLSISLIQKVRKVSVALFSSIAKGVYVNLETLGTSFKYTVLGYYGPTATFRLPADFYLVVFKIIFWVLEVGFCMATTSYRLFMENFRDKIADGLYLNRFAEEGVNTFHIQTKALALDASGVPADVTVDSLLTIYDEINFTNQHAPGYMKESSRSEGGAPYSIEDLRGSLSDSFIHNVKGRVAFLGTPPASDMPRLLSFYQQIEDAVRLSIHKSNEQLAEFRRTNGNNVGAYSANTLNTYKGLLEDRARIAIDLAIAGKHCGARFMGDAMTVHSSFYKDSIGGQLNLQEHLFELLALKRKEVALAQIQTHLGEDTHAYSNYMSTLGKTLALPGTENVVEHLSRKLNADEYLEKFFAEYTVSGCIIPTLQAAIKDPKGQPLREKITNWIQTQAGNWNKEAFNQKALELTEAIEAILKENAAEIYAAEDLGHLNALITHLTDNNVDLPSADQWGDFITELFSNDAARAWRDNTFGAAQGRQKIYAIQQTLSEESLGEDVISKLKEMLQANQPVNIEALKPALQSIAKVGKIQRLFQEKEFPSLNPDTIRRLIRGESHLNTTLVAHLDNIRGHLLLEQLDLTNLATNGLSPMMMEWLLVSQHVLLPQKLLENQGSAPGNLAPNAAQRLFETVLDGFKKSCQSEFDQQHAADFRNIRRLNANRRASLIEENRQAQLAHAQKIQKISTWVNQNLSNVRHPNHPDKQRLEQEAEALLTSITGTDPHNNNRRWRPGETSSRDALLALIFDRSIRHQPDTILQVAQRTDPSLHLSYPLWKRVCYIDLPKKGAAIFNNTLVKIALSVSLALATGYAFYLAYEATAHLVAARVVPFVINNTPIEMIRAGNLLAARVEMVAKWVFKNPFLFLFETFLVREFVVHVLPRIPYVTAAFERIDLRVLSDAIFRSPQTIARFALSKVFNIAVVGWNASSSIGESLRNCARKTEQEQMALYKNRMGQLWNKTIQAQAAA